jgi:tetratricopeptide (TPR) repeat protein
MLGLIQEQHPDRCRLFMQWRDMRWPVMVDSLDLVRIGVVPLTLAIDEHGIIRHVGLRPDQAEQIDALFLSREYPAAEEGTRATAAMPTAPGPSSPGASWRAWGDRLFVGGTSGLDGALDAWGEAVARDPDDGWSHFRLGVGHRARYDGAARRSDDFRLASEHWSRALEIDPNNYIWRRRIQQYGPRLAKPYPFYDWVPRARAEIEARGEQPVALTVEPSGAEYALPDRGFASTAPGEEREPDRAGRIQRDEAPLILAEWAAVPAIVEAGQNLRLHLSLRPNAARRAHWNNEVDELVAWLDPPRGWRVQRRLLRHPLPAEALSTEVRVLEVELSPDPSVPSAGQPEMPLYALYYVCEDVTGTCLYRRQDLRVAWQLQPTAR